MPECGDLRVQTDDTGVVLSAWQMSWRERFSALFFGRAWLCISSGGKTQPPVWLKVERDVHVDEAEVEA